ncbi:hypothetical protein F4604DRAFT_1582008, partial [Suillus subluteus]
VNNEIRCLMTYIHDEECYLQACQTQLEPSCPGLAHQVGLRCLMHSRANAHLLQCMADIAQLPGFSGSISVSVSTKNSPGDSASTPHAHIPAQFNVQQDLRDDTPSLRVIAEDTDLRDDLEDEEEAVQVFHDVLCVSADS